jgi:hypothetical protein
MLRTVITTALLLLLRRTSFRVVLVGYVLLCAGGCLGACSDLIMLAGTSAVRARHTFGTQVLLTQSVLVSLLTPWVVARAMQDQRGDHLVRGSALTWRTPWQLAGGTLLATSLYLCQLLLLSLPMLTLIVLLGAATISTIGWSYITLGVWLFLVQLSTLGWSVLVARAFPAFVLAYVTLGGLSVGRICLHRATGDLATLLVVVGLSGCLVVCLRWYCNTRFVYLKA